MYLYYQIKNSVYRRRSYVFTCLLVALLLFPVLSRAMDFPKPKGLLNDFAGVIDPVHRHKILAVITELMQKTGIPIVVVTMPTINGADYNDYANRLYEAWGIGKKGIDKGVLIFLTMKERKMRIEVGYGMEGVIPDGLAGEIRDKYMLPYLKKNQFGQGILNGVVAIAKIIAQDAGVKLSGNVRLKRPGGKKSSLSAIIFLFIPLAVFFFAGRRSRASWLLLPLFFGGSDNDSGFGGGGFTGGFGGFGGGMSGGGGAGGGF